MHYFTLTIPLYLVGLCMMQELEYCQSIKGAFCNIKKEKRIKECAGRMQVCFAVLLILGILYYGVHLVVYSGGNLLKLTTHYYMEESDLHKEQASVIPRSEKKSVLAYNVPAKWYMETDILPCFRYAFFQEKFRLGIPDMDKEFEILLKNRPPKWLAIGNLDQIQMKIVKAVLRENYEFVSEADNISLFRFVAGT